MTPVQFFFSVALCGLWHAAATTAFSQHWNDQGIARFKSAVEAASRFVVESMQIDVSAISTNAVLHCR